MGQLKEWKVRLKKLKKVIQKKKKQVRQIGVELEAHKNKARKLESKIEGINSREIVLSPHAVLRFQERVKSSLTLPEISSYLICQDLYDMVNNEGDGRYFLSRDKNIIVVVEDRTIKTVWMTK